MERPRHPAVTRALKDGHEAVTTLFVDGLSGSDATAVQLEIAQRTAQRTTPAHVLRQYENDRFTTPGNGDPMHLLRTELLALETVSDRFEPVVVAPLVPLGTHSVIAGVSQNRVVTTTRRTEVAADPSNTLTLEAAVRRRTALRRDPHSTEAVNLAAVQRVTRAQRFDGPLSFAHFSLLGLVTAGRDTGNHQFERDATVLHIGALADVCVSAGADEVSVRLTDFTGKFRQHVADISERVATQGITLVADKGPTAGRTAGREYYPSLCFSLWARFGHETFDLGDGGTVPWTQRLVASNKERLMISGLGLERLALVRR